MPAAGGSSNCAAGMGNWPRAGLSLKMQAKTCSVLLHYAGRVITFPAANSSTTASL
ncbi:hypothetical protein ABIB48_003717 [Arthrobacter sp. UYCu511]